MSWVKEWQLMLEQREIAVPLNIELYNTLRQYCRNMDIIYQSPLYDEFVEWEERYGGLYRTIDGSPFPNEQHFIYFAVHSPTIQFQKKEKKIIEHLENMAKKHKIRFHDDNIMEKISLAAHYLGLGKAK